MINTKMSPRQLLLQRIGFYPFRRILFSAIDLWAENEMAVSDDAKRQSIVSSEQQALRHVIATLCPPSENPYLDGNIYPQYSETNTLAHDGGCQNPNEDLIKACKMAREHFRAMGDDGYEQFLQCNAAILESEEVYL